jgi:hypothetical protein
LAGRVILGDLSEQLAGYGRVDEGVARQGALDGFYQFAARPVFQQIPIGTGPNCIEKPFVIIISGQHQHADLWKLFANLPGGQDTVHHRHLQIHQDQIGLQTGNHFERFEAVVSLSNHTDLTIRFQDALQAFANDLLIITDQYFYHVPAPR